MACFEGILTSIDNGKHCLFLSHSLVPCRLGDFLVYLMEKEGFSAHYWQNGYRHKTYSYLHFSYQQRTCHWYTSHKYMILHIMLDSQWSHYVLSRMTLFRDLSLATWSRIVKFTDKLISYTIIQCFFKNLMILVYYI